MLHTHNVIGRATCSSDPYAALQAQMQVLGMIKTAQNSPRTTPLLKTRKSTRALQALGHY